MRPPGSHLRKGSRSPSAVMNVESVNLAVGFGSGAACAAAISARGTAGSIAGAQPHNPTKTSSQIPQKSEKKRGRFLKKQAFGHMPIELAALLCTVANTLQLELLVDRRAPSSGSLIV